MTVAIDQEKTGLGNYFIVSMSVQQIVPNPLPVTVYTFASVA